MLNLILFSLWACTVFAGLSTIYFFIFSLAGRVSGPKTTEAGIFRSRIAVFIPAYQEDAVILDTATRALEQSYPSHLYQVIVIADRCSQKTLSSLGELPIVLFEVDFENSTKAKALNYALSHLDPDRYDLAVVLDADNLMAPDFLEKINAQFVSGSEIIQGKRVAKNTDTPIAFLDAVSESINNHIFRRGHVALGLSAALIGSGMAMKYDLYKRYLSSLKAVGGFDKELELALLRDGHNISYAENAVLFDEKVRKSSVLVSQRTRWLAAQITYLRLHLLPATKSVIRTGNVDYFNKALQTLLPPRILLALFTPAIPLLFVLLGQPGSAVFATALCGIFGLSISMSIPRAYFRRVLFNLWRIPYGAWLMLKALFNSRNANGRFIHTPHGQI